MAPGPGGLRGQDGEREEDAAGEKLVGAERRGGGVGVEQHACLSPQQRRRGRRLTEATAFAPNVTECYFQVTLHSFNAILRDGDFFNGISRKWRSFDGMRPIFSFF